MAQTPRPDEKGTASFVLYFFQQQYVQHQEETGSTSGLQVLAICHWWRRAIDGAILVARKAGI
jgi:hypothetical protein